MNDEMDERLTANEVIEEAIRDLIEHGNLTIGITEDGAIAIWLWDQDPATDEAYFADGNYDDALYGAALKFKGV